MKKILNWLVVIVIIIGCLFIQRKFFPTVITTTTSDTVWQDSIYVFNYIPKPYPVYIDTTTVDSVILPIDSAAIVAAYLKVNKLYYSTYTYKDTLKNDSIAYIELTQRITQNKPIEYNLTYLNKIPSVINNTTNIYSQNELYLGAGIGLHSFTPGLKFKHKKGYIIEGNYDVLNSSITVGAYVNINKLKLW